MATWLAFGGVTVDILGTLGVSPEVRQVLDYVLLLGLLVIGIEIVWRADGGERAAVRSGSALRAALVTAALVALWLLWIAGAHAVFWLAVFIIALPLAIGVTQRSVVHVLRPPGAEDATSNVPSVLTVSIERGARALLIIGAVVLLARAWQVDFVSLTMQDTLFTRLVRGALSAVVIALIADFVWSAIKTLIDRKLFEAQGAGAADSEDARHRARLRTLLPILRNVLSITVLAVAVMMALAAVGIEIGPLIAGAGVVGVAIGFGAQTLVKDIFSGVFYLIDDAFRVGEYIQSGSYKGTVESFSLRSIKLRHHRGPLYTVPFGELGAVQNMSRDWVIDKLTIGLTYDTDLDRVKKIVKEIGKELANDPEFAPHIIEPLKMQGVDQFGDYAIQVRMKMMTRPGEQFTIRRKAYALLKKAFDANGVQFAFPTVQVAGNGDPQGAAARQALAGAKPPVEE